MDNLLKGNNKEYLYRDYQNDIFVRSQSISKSSGPGMTSDKSAADAYDHPIYRETSFMPAQTNGPVMKRYQASFEVIKDEEGNLCAADKKQMIFTDGKNEAELVDNIRDAVECYFEVPYSDVEIKIVYR